ncbi:MAG: ATP-binding protein [Planctomycetaceae bacterium]|jgi:energy-coupling factor transporter ATP-binding protein EcfA2|nr:ATP-binding protein [Planctomycetaceae bacterium]
MQRIEIENFGPIKHAAFDINDYTVFIGPQASGKSTITRLVYFFMSIEKELYSILIDPNGAFARPSLELWKKKIRKKFNDYWDHSFLHKETQITFFLDNSKKISINNFKNGLPDVFMNKSLESVFEQESDLLVQKNKEADNVKNTLSKLFYSFAINNFLRNILSSNPDCHNYIPDGRTIFSDLYNELILSADSYNEFISDRYSFNNNILMRQFISIVNYIRNEFRKRPVEERILNLRQYKSSTPDLSKHIDIVEKIYKFMSQILHGKYCYENNIDFIYIDTDTDTDKKIPLSSSSSGQREAIWILYDILFYELQSFEDTERQSLFTVIEEPESHLFPEGQRNMMYALTLFANLSKNQLMLTTHSPYILTPLSNLLYAFNLGQSETKRERIAEIIDPDLWINPKQFECYYVDKGTIESVVDRETNIINLDKLDTASAYGNEELDKLLELEN